jgi:hypothetical protein
MGSSSGVGPYVGHFVPWDGGCLLIGQGAAAVPVHAHYAIQIAFGSVPGIRFRTGAHDAWAEYAGAIIPSRQPHAMDATRVTPNVVLFVEPETRWGRALAERHLKDGIAPIPPDVVADVGPPLFAAWREERSTAAMERAARRVIHALTGDADPSVASDERILRATAYIRAHLEAPLTLEEVAAEACLSPAPLRGADRDGAAAVHPLAALPARVGAAHGRRVALDGRAPGRLRRRRAPLAHLAPHVRLPAVAHADAGAAAAVGCRSREARRPRMTARTARTLSPFVQCRAERPD